MSEHFEQNKVMIGFEDLNTDDFLESATDVTEPSSKQAEIGDAVMTPAVNSRIDTPYALDKLISCFNRVLPWLSMADLWSLGATCTGMSKFVGEYFQKNFDVMPFLSYKDSIYSRDAGKVRLNEYIQNVRITPHSNCKIIADECDSLKKVVLSNLNLSNLTPTLIDYIQKILKNVQVLGLVDCNIKDDFHGNVLKWCPQLKHLHIHDCNIGSKSFSNEYKSLQCLRLITPQRIKGLMTFLEINPNISTLEISSYFIFKYFDLLQNTKAKIDEFTVFEAGTEIDNIVPDLIELYEQERFERLNIFAHHLDAPLMHLLELLSPLRKITCFHIMQDIEMPILPNLKVFMVENLKTALSKDFIAALVNLEEFSAYQTPADQITILIEHAKKLKNISIVNVKFGEHLNEGVLDVAALNQRRENVPKAKNVTIYTGERVFLATKWATNQLIFSKVELRQCIQDDEWWDNCISS